MKTTKGMRSATVWKLCIEMWDWIAERIRVGSTDSVETLKRQWCAKKGYDLYAKCFFCDWAKRHTKRVLFCSKCPGRNITKTFSCQALAYDYQHDPLKFRAKLHRMNTKRLKMLKGKK